MPVVAGCGRYSERHSSSETRLQPGRRVGAQARCLGHVRLSAARGRLADGLSGRLAHLGGDLFEGLTALLGGHLSAQRGPAHGLDGTLDLETEEPPPAVTDRLKSVGTSAYGPKREPT